MYGSIFFASDITYFFSFFTALAFDPLQKIMAIGNRTGKVRIYGRPGVDLEFEHKKEVAVLKIIFVVNTGRLLTATADNAISLVGFFLSI
jgi:syntaxin-binding protein 5